MKYYANLHGNIIQWLYHDCKVLGLGIWVVKTSAYHHSTMAVGKSFHHLFLESLFALAKISQNSF
jgi:hypothetical protein